MWQDKYISERDGEFVCWDREGEFITSVHTRQEARKIITEYKDGIERKKNANTIQQFTGTKQQR